MAKQSQSTISVPASLVLQIGAWGRLTVTLLGQLRRRAGLKPQRTLDDQAWYWSEQWQQWERQADEDIVADRVRKFGSVDDLIADLDACGERWNHAAYVFDRAHERGDDVATLVEQAQQLGYPVRYWWLSEAMQLHGHPDRLIVCAHHPSSAADAGMDLYEALKEHEVTWDDLEAAAVGEYRYFGKAIEGPELIWRRDGTLLFPPATRESLV